MLTDIMKSIAGWCCYVSYVMGLTMETATIGMEFFGENFTEINRDCHMSWWTKLCQL